MKTTFPKSKHIVQNDCETRKTGSDVFNFTGDGKYEKVVLDMWSDKGDIDFSAPLMINL